MTPRERAEQALKFFEDPVMKLVFVDIRDYLVSKLEKLTLPNHEAEHELILMLQLLKLFPVQLKKYIDEETVARSKIRQQKFIDSKREKLP